MFAVSVGSFPGSVCNGRELVGCGGFGDPDPATASVTREANGSTIWKECGRRDGC
jgi:hypothetical protein